MKCHSMAALMEKYIDNELGTADRELFERHLSACPDCRDEIRLLRRLRAEQQHQRNVKAPEGFTDAVMAAVYKLPPEKRPLVTLGKRDERFRNVYRKLGYSLIVTAGIIMFSLLVPVAGIHPQAISGSVQSSVESSGSTYKNIFTGIDNEIMSILNAHKGPGTDNEGGTGNGM